MAAHDVRRLRGQIVAALRKYPGMFRGTLAVKLQDVCGWMPWEIDHELDTLIRSGVVVTPKPDKALLWLAEQPPKQEQGTLFGQERIP